MLMKSYLRISFILAISLPISWAKPVTERSDLNTPLQKSKDLCFLQTKHANMEASKEDAALSPSYQLLKYTLKSFKDLSLLYVRKAKNISDQLLKNSQILGSHSVKVLEFKKNLTQFEEKYALCDGIDDLFELVNLYSNATSFYFELEETALDDDAKLIHSLLKKYGSGDLDEESLKLFDLFVDKFELKYAKIRENLNKDESKIAKKMMQWFTRFKALKNYDEKIAAFESFFVLFEEDEN